MDKRPPTLLWSVMVSVAIVLPGIAEDGSPKQSLSVSSAGMIGDTLHQLAMQAGSNPATPESSSASAPRRITLHTADTEIGNALRLVAQQGGLNLVIGPEVKGEISVYLEDVPVQTALRAIALNNGFVYTVDDNVITVSKPPEAGDNQQQVPPLVTRIFTLQWQDAERVKDALEFALTRYGKMKVLNENSQRGYGVQRLSSLGGDLDNQNPVARAATGASGSNTAGRTALPGGNMVRSEPPRHARTMVVTDVPENIARIADLIADLDKLPRQVLIEARIIEMSTDLQRQLGIDWDISVLASGPVLNHELPLNWRAGFSGGTQIRHSPDGTVQTSTGLALGTIDFSQLTALFRAHQTDNAIRLLANPRMLVHNNHSASILVGERYPILKATITDFGTVTEAFDTYIPVGVQLEVTPTIMMDGRISMLVHPATSALGDDVIGTTGLRVARIRTREMDTRVIMRDGQTVVLGGLISDRKTRTINKVPGLGDWPVLSLFFRQENPRSERVDLLIFLTAHIEAATEISARDLEVFDMYRPHFKHLERLQDVPLHFEIPTEFRDPKPMFGDPPLVDSDEADRDRADDDGTVVMSGPPMIDRVAAGADDAGKERSVERPTYAERSSVGSTTPQPPRDAGEALGRGSPGRGFPPGLKAVAKTPHDKKRMKIRHARQMQAISAAEPQEGP